MRSEYTQQAGKRETLGEFQGSQELGDGVKLFAKKG